jgi:D-glycero-D-manno-heptose 1,7-bisphosphate phosphatase
MTGDTVQKKAVFIDRDGVINRLVLNPDTDAFESPLKADQFLLIDSAVDALRMLKENGFLLFVVSNQPSYAKGKNSMADLNETHERMISLLETEGFSFDSCYYCYHHPEAVVSGLKLNCECRKPGTLFLKQAQDEFNIDLSASWFVGDRITDMKCGKRAECRTVLVKSEDNTGKAVDDADYYAVNMIEAARIILDNG